MRLDLNLTVRALDHVGGTVHQQKGQNLARSCREALPAFQPCMVIESRKQRMLQMTSDGRMHQDFMFGRLQKNLERRSRKITIEQGSGGV